MLYLATVFSTESYLNSNITGNRNVTEGLVSHLLLTSVEFSTRWEWFDIIYPPFQAAILHGRQYYSDKVGNSVSTMVYIGHLFRVDLRVFTLCLCIGKRFYPKRLTNEDRTLQLTSKLTISYIEGKPLVTLCQRWRGHSVEMECRQRGTYKQRKCSRGGREVQGKSWGKNEMTTLKKLHFTLTENRYPKGEAVFSEFQSVVQYLLDMSAHFKGETFV